MPQPVPPPNNAQPSGIEGVSEQLERNNPPVSSAQSFLIGLKDMEHRISKEDLGRALRLLDMAEDELGHCTCFNRFRESKFRQ